MMRKPNGRKPPTFWVLVAALCCSWSAAAQGPGSRGGGGERQFRGAPDQPKRDADLDRGPALAPNAPVVADIQVVGNQFVSKERVLSNIRTKKGYPYEEATVKSDTARLYGTYLFFDVRAEFEDAPAGRIVRFHVIERPVIQDLQFIGNKTLKQ